MTEEQKPIAVKIPTGWTRSTVARNSAGDGWYDWIAHIYGAGDVSGGDVQEQGTVCVARIVQSGGRPREEAEAIVRLLGGAEQMVLALEAIAAISPEFGDPEDLLGIALAVARIQLDALGLSPPPQSNLTMRMLATLKEALPVLEWADSEAAPPEFVEDDPWAVRVGRALSDVREVLADIEKSEP